MVAGANSLLADRAGHGPLVARVTAVDRATAPTSELPRLYFGRRCGQRPALSRHVPDPPPDDGSRDWKLLVGDSSSGFSGMSGYYGTFLEPGEVLRTVERSIRSAPIATAW
jgi:hypothetical protein